MCEKYKLNAMLFVPRECLVKYGKMAHRICENCWWDEDAGFAKENGTHKCPGCQKNVVLTMSD